MIVYCLFIITDVIADTQKPVHIQADKMVASPTKKFIVFQGNVKVTQDNIQLSAETLRVYMISSENTVTMTKESVQKIDASGNVRILWNDYRIEAETAEYLPPKNKLMVSGNMARLYQGTNTIAGSSIVLNLETDQVEISSKKGEQVEAIYEFSDQDMKEFKPKK
jgi:lipopolysaccharide export system protein LptA